MLGYVDPHSGLISYHALIHLHLATKSIDGNLEVSPVPSRSMQSSDRHFNVLENNWLMTLEMSVDITRLNTNFYRTTLCQRGICYRRVFVRLSDSRSLCLSVRLSVTSRHCTKMAKRRITQTTPYMIAQG